MAGPTEAEVAPPADAAPATSQQLWSGGALDGEEASALFVGRRPRVIVVVGAREAGKSCLMCAQFQAIANGRPRGFGWRFCHSRTLRAFEQLSDKAWAWSGEAAERIVDRTNQGSWREPGFLHYAFMPRVNGQSEAVEPRVRDVVLTDMPGEWFERWSNHDTERALIPFITQAHAFWVVVDATTLSNRTRRREAADLLGRTVDEAKGRPIALVLTKTDRVDGDLTERLKAVTTPLERHRGPTQTFQVSAFPAHPGESGPVDVLAPLRWVLDQPEPPEAPPPRQGERYFHLFREAPEAR